MPRHGMMYDGRRLPPRNSRGEFRRRRGDRGMDYGDMRDDMKMRDGRVIRSYPRRDYGEDMRGDYERDGHYQHGRQSGYEPVEFMGYCQGYYGSPEQDYGRGRDYGYDMRGRRDYGYDYGYPYGDFGETLSEQELDEWCKKLMSHFDERERQMFNKDTIMQKAKQMGKQMEGFGEKELYVATVMAYSDYKDVIGANPDMALRLGYAWLADKDVAVKGANKLATYYDCIVEGEDD